MRTVSPAQAPPHLSSVVWSRYLAWPSHVWPAVLRHLMSILMSTLKIYPIIHWRGPLIVKTDHSPHFEFVQFSVFTGVWPDCLWWPSRCRLSFDISYSNVFSLPDILYGISPWSRFKLVRYFIFRKTGGSGQRPCPWRRQPGSGCTSRPCQGESCLAGPALTVVHWSSQISLRSHLTSSTSISKLTYTFIIFCSAHQLLRK